MNQTARKIHLWVGLILSLVLLIEAVTGLILAETWITGQQRKAQPLRSGVSLQNLEQTKSLEARASVPPRSRQGCRRN
jgi:uncharacterized iron-regulated membrane protein